MFLAGGSLAEDTRVLNSTFRAYASEYPTVGVGPRPRTLAPGEPRCFAGPECGWADKTNLAGHGGPPTTPAA